MSPLYTQINNGPTQHEINLEARTYYYERRIDDFKSWLKVEVQKNPSFASVAQKITELFPVVKNV